MTLVIATTEHGNFCPPGYLFLSSFHLILKSLSGKFNFNELFLFVFRIIAPTVTLQGNLDPACLYSSHVSDSHLVLKLFKELIQTPNKEVDKCLKDNLQSVVQGIRDNIIFLLLNLTQYDSVYTFYAK